MPNPPYRILIVDKIEVATLGIYIALSWTKNKYQFLKKTNQRYKKINTTDYCKITEISKLNG